MGNHTMGIHARRGMSVPENPISGTRSSVTTQYIPVLFQKEIMIQASTILNEITSDVTEDF